jgi:hypothetical protein
MFDDPLIDLARGRVATELGAQIGGPVHAFGRQAGVQEKRPPAQPDRPIRAHRAGALEPHEADVAPGAGEIGDEIDVDRRWLLSARLDNHGDVSCARLFA